MRTGDLDLSLDQYQICSCPLQTVRQTNRQDATLNALHIGGGTINLGVTKHYSSADNIAAG